MADHLDLPDGWTLEHVLSGWRNLDEPLPNLAGFDRLAETTTPADVRWLVDWVEPQATITYLIRHHGFDGSGRVLEGIARAAAHHRVPMGRRIYGVAGAMGLEQV